MTVHYEMKTTLLKNAVADIDSSVPRIFDFDRKRCLGVYRHADAGAVRVLPVLPDGIVRILYFYATFTKMQEQQEKMKKAEEEESETEQALLESMESAKRERTDRNLNNARFTFPAKPL